MLNRTSTDIYLDANATTRVLPQAAHEAQAAMEELFGNPSSSHISGLRARYILESARSLAKLALGADSGKIIFTSGATEAIQTAVLSSLCASREANCEPARGPRKLLYGATEHKAVPQALHHWNQMLGIGAEVLAIPVDQSGMLDLEFLREHVGSADMVCTMAVNNETGAIHDLASIERVIREQNDRVAWLVDSVQAIGKIDLSLSDTTIDYAPISGHKLHAPKGIGLLYVRDGAPLTPLMAGGGQESGARSGTENLPGVAALAAVFRCLEDRQDGPFHSPTRLGEFRDRLVASLQEAFPSIVFNTPFDSAVPTTINFSVQAFAGKEILDLFDAAGIRVSSGSACGSAIQGSYVLDAMGFPAWRSEGAIRVSFGPTISEQEIDTACRRIEEAGRALCHSCLMVSDHLDESPSEPVDGLVQLKKGSMCSWILFDADSKQCVIVDPFEELAERIESLVRCQQGRVLAILDTHTHVDHDSCRDVLLKLLGEQVLPAAQQSDRLGWPSNPQGTIELSDGSVAPFVSLGGKTILACTDLGGHTTDGRAYLVGTADQGKLPSDLVRFAFSGDTIQIGGIGRCDFDVSSTLALYNSLQRLPQIIDSRATIVCPTHDYNNGFCTTLTAESSNNSLLARVTDPLSPLSLAEFTAEREAIDAQIADEPAGELICGLIQPLPSEKSAIDISPAELASYFAQHRNSLIIDIREAHEHRFAQNWSSLGLEDSPENVPLTRFSNFLSGLLATRESLSERDIIFVCRSGNRSGKAAEVLRRLGIDRALHIAGGLALGVNEEESADMGYVI